MRSGFIAGHGPLELGDLIFVVSAAVILGDTVAEV